MNRSARNSSKETTRYTTGKKQGESKEDCIATIRKGWEGDCRFKMGLTDGTDEDLKTIINYVETNW